MLIFGLWVFIGALSALWFLKNLNDQGDDITLGNIVSMAGFSLLGPILFIFVLSINVTWDKVIIKGKKD